MLKGIDPRLNADLLYVLRAMGHGDVLAVVDTNFPAASVAAHGFLEAPIRCETPTAAEAVAAILSVMPLDTFAEDPAMRMQVVDAPDEVPAVQSEVQAAIDSAEGRPRPMRGIERFAFYEAAQRAFAVVQTGERRFYGCFLLRKGVIPPEAG